MIPALEFRAARMRYMSRRPSGATVGRELSTGFMAPASIPLEVIVSCAFVRASSSDKKAGAVGNEYVFPHTIFGFTTTRRNPATRAKRNSANTAYNGFTLHSQRSFGFRGTWIGSPSGKPL